MLLSVVVPCYNEEEVLPETHRSLAGVLGGIAKIDFEIIYVDDGSADGTAACLRRLQAQDSHVRVVRLSRNFGHQIAVTAGLDSATGDAVVIIDSDLQDPPEVIEEMLARWREGFEVAYGLRVHREGETQFKLVTAKLFYRLINWLSEIQIPLDVGDFRLLDRKVVDALADMPERARFIRGMVSWVGFRQVAVPYSRAPRAAGETKYPFWKMVSFAAIAVSSFSVAPLKLAMWTGFAASAVALAGIVYALVVRLFTNDWVTGWAGVFIAILFLGGVQLISLGIIGEYVGRIYNEAKRRPLFLVAERLGFPTEAR
ncbi:MAG: glycosyltransferase family 2 protein [Gemmatimonadales bacterium]